MRQRTARPCAKLLPGLLAAVVLSACTLPPSEPLPFDKPRGPFISGQPIAKSKIGAVRQPFVWPMGAYDPAFLSTYQAGLKNKTFRAWEKGHGTQVEFLAANGRTYLWYPGNTRAVAGTWEVVAKPIPSRPDLGNRSVEICVRYGPNTYNPVTGSRDGSPECTPIKFYTMVVDEYAPGDPFHLASGKVPFVLDRHSTTLDDLYAEASGR
ncbi:hypothetical protein [Mangrovicella endophytica]|uniref:hypothetical protein n=1 Tax=Mangrovicella endophytica TaxID=2066697 RepID=UPI000C9E2CB9|nr:hypothetical protein [Mangrovicella endophytica]